MSKTSSVTRYHHGNLRAAAVDAAARQIDQEGSEGVSLRGIAREIGVSSAALYRHFARRDDLIDALAAKGETDLSEALEASVNWAVQPRDGRDSWERLLTLGSHYLAFAERRPALVGLMQTRGSVTLENFLRRSLKDIATTNRRVPSPSENTVFAARCYLEGIAGRLAATRLRASGSTDEGAAGIEELVDRLKRLIA